MSRVTDPDDDDFFQREPTEDWSSRPVPGIPGLLLGLVKPSPYPINIYNLDDDSVSGLAGTLFPDGTFVPLPSTGVGLTLSRTGAFPTNLYWEDRAQQFVTGWVVWDSTVNDSLDHAVGPHGSHRRVWDASILGDWPNHPPRAGRVVNPEKARLAEGEE